MMSFVRSQQISVVAFLLLVGVLLFGMYNTYTAPTVEKEAFPEYPEDGEIPEDGVQQYAGEPSPPPPQGFVLQPPPPPEPMASNDPMSYVGSPNYMNHADLYCGGMGMGMMM